MRTQFVEQHPLSARMVADAVRLLHLSMIVFILTGWAWPWRWAWYGVAILVPALHLHWKTNDDICVLTTIEWKLRGRIKPVDDADEGLFLYGLLLALFGWKPSRRTLMIMVHSSIYSAVGISLARIFFSAA